MELIFESPRQRVVCSAPEGAGTTFDGRSTSGMAWLAIRTFAEGEGIPKIHNHARPVSNVLAGLEPGAPLISRPPAMFGQRTDDAVVPRDVFESLSPDTIVGIDWEFVPEVAEM